MNKSESDSLNFSTETNHEPIKVYDSTGIVWRQQGPELVGFKDGIEYHAFIGNDRVMVGIDEKGLPILASRNDEEL